MTVKVVIHVHLYSVVWKEDIQTLSLSDKTVQKRTVARMARLRRSMVTSSTQLFLNGTPIPPVMSMHLSVFPFVRNHLTVAA
jgi:hypothetical protein